jgi:aminoglycoside phosphotransferase
MTTRTSVQPGGSSTSYRERLGILVADDVPGLLDTWAAERAVPVGGPWRREHGRLKPGRSPWAVLVYDAPAGPTLRVRLFEHGDPRALDAPSVAGLGRVEVLPCEQDPGMPGIPAVLDVLDDAQVVRYRPGNRCTIRGRQGGGIRWVKVLGKETDDQEEARARWAAGSSGTLSFAVAEPLGWDESTRASWYGEVPGSPLPPLLRGPHRDRLLRQVGRSLGELAVSGLRPGRLDGPDVQLARTARAVRRAVDAAPSVAPVLQRAMEVLDRAHGRLAPRDLVPTHGAAHLNQWLVDDSGRLGLVDFDRFALGEPEFDLATFLAEAAAESALRGVADEVTTHVVAGFTEVAGAPDPARLALYTLHKRVAKVARTATALRPDAEERAGREVAALADALGLFAAG